MKSDGVKGGMAEERFNIVLCSGIVRKNRFQAGLVNSMANAIGYFTALPLFDAQNNMRNNNTYSSKK